MSNSFRSLHPDQRVLMGPGPSNVHPRVLSAMARPTVGHLDPWFSGFMEDLKELLRMALRTRNALTFPVSAPGSAGMETCIVNLVEPGDKVLVAVNGVFGKRMVENVVNAGGVPITLDFAWGTTIDPQQVEDALKANPDVKILAFVHAETSTGVRADAATLAEIGRRHDCLVLMDAVTSVAGIPVEVDGWGIDAVYSGTQKCLSCPPGLSPVSFSDRAVAAVKARKTPVQSWFLDLTKVMAYWDGSGGRSYHHTAPVNALYGLHESLVMLAEEGLENSWARHAAMHEELKAGLAGLGIEFLVAPESRLPQLNAIKVPEGIDEAAVRAHVLDRFSLEIGAGLGALAGKIWRVGLMGQTAQRSSVTLCVEAMRDALAAQGR
ncbi:alanine--glyoxylate aminotransferase family protein [Iodidimonas sp. SYSU 1G8]|uniref:pyridoxal-phosphate-dependent aminotransferase family protein n=1 Tax=Iodidimonas sp. SYSU 1G8 TaxID=3133967 RepID=UPI0031FE5A15